MFDGYILQRLMCWAGMFCWGESLAKLGASGGTGARGAAGEVSFTAWRRGLICGEAENSGEDWDSTANALTRRMSSDCSPHGGRVRTARCVWRRCMQQRSRLWVMGIKLLRGLRLRIAPCVAGVHWISSIPIRGCARWKMCWGASLTASIADARITTNKNLADLPGASCAGCIFRRGCAVVWRTLELARSAHGLWLRLRRRWPRLSCLCISNPILHPADLVSIAAGTAGRRAIGPMGGGEAASRRTGGAMNWGRCANWATCGFRSKQALAVMVPSVPIRPEWNVLVNPYCIGAFGEVKVRGYCSRFVFDARMFAVR